MGRNRCTPLGSILSELVLSLRARAWTGYDPYDALLSPIAPALPGPRARQLWVQLHKRAPINLRRLSRVPTTLMGKTAALALIASDTSARVRELIGEDAARLRAAIVQKTQHDGRTAWWGYEFPVQTRWAYYGALTPNAVTTHFAVRALLSSAQPDTDHEWMIDVGRFVEQTFVRGERGAYYRYVPGASAQIHNASLLSAVVAATLGRTFGVDAWVEQSRDAAETVVAAQRPDGGWPYGEGRGLAWRDAFHSMYVLTALSELTRIGAGDLSSTVEFGLAAFIRDFIDEQRHLRYFRGKPAEAEAHNVGTCVDGLIRLARFSVDAGVMADAVLRWGVTELWDPERNRFRLKRSVLASRSIDYPRWCDGHMLLALATHEASGRDG